MDIVIDADSARQQRDRHNQKAEHYEREAQRERDNAAIWQGRADRAEAGNPVKMTPSRRGQLWGDRA